MKEEVISRAAFSVWRLPVGQMRANCYILIDKPSNEALVIDPGDDAQYIIETVSSLAVIPKMIIATHGHFDHILGGFEVQQTLKIPFALHPADRFLVDRMRETAEHFLGCSVVEPSPSVDKELKGNEVFNVGNLQIKIHETPGHTPGSVCLEVVDYAILFTGDTIFAEGGVGRTDFSYSDRKALEHSLTRILSLSSDMILLPGHGNDTTVAQEKGTH